MKILIVSVFLFLFCFTGYSQVAENSNLTRSYSKQNWKSLLLVYLAGFGEGHAELLQHHYYKFEKRFPNANKQFWDPELSWTNKYKNNDPAKGPKFWGSSNIFVATTDGYHAFKLLQKASIVGALAININGRKKFKHYVIDAIIYLTTYTVGFYTSYKIIYS